MDSSPIEVALLPIHPRFAELILSGEKRVEFRRRSPRRPFGLVLMYATSPRQRVVGMFELAAVAKDTPENLWTRYAAIGGVDQETFTTYYEGTDAGVAYIIDRVWALETPLPLSALGSRNVPQSLSYFPLATLETVETLGGPMREMNRPGCPEFAGWRGEQWPRQASSGQNRPGTH
jgi:predicted transcriptional regulator